MSALFIFVWRFEGGDLAVLGQWGAGHSQEYGTQEGANAQHWVVVGPAREAGTIAIQGVLWIGPVGGYGVGWEAGFGVALGVWVGGGYRHLPALWRPQQALCQPPIGQGHSSALMHWVRSCIPLPAAPARLALMTATKCVVMRGAWRLRHAKRGAGEQP